MKNPDDKLTRDELLQGAGAASIASLLAAAIAAAPQEAAAAAKPGDLGVGPWNLSLEKSPTKPNAFKKKATAKANPLPTTPVDLILHSITAPVDGDIPVGYTLIKLYELDLPAWIRGKNDDDTPVGNGADWQAMKYPRYIAMCKKS